jgi:hypothetical protein
MKQTLIRYRTLPERADENQRLIEAVFAELDRTRSPGVRYLVLRLPDDSFVHLVFNEQEGPSPVAQLDAFRAFQKGVRERCVEPPQASAAIIVGNHRVIGP